MIVELNAFQNNSLATRLGDQLQGVVEDSERRQPEEVHLEQP